MSDERIFEVLSRLEQDTKEIKSDIREVKESQANFITRLTILETREEKTREEQVALWGILDMQKKKMDQLEKKLKINNIILKGAEEQERESFSTLKNIVQEIMTNTLKADITCDDIKSVKRLGLPKKDYVRPILIEMQSWEKKIEILRNRTNLKGTQLYIDSDLTKGEQQSKKQLREFFKKFKNEGHNVTLVHNNIKYQNKLYKLENMEDLEADIQNDTPKPSTSSLQEDKKTTKRSDKNKQGGKGGHGPLTPYLKLRSRNLHGNKNSIT